MIKNRAKFNFEDLFILFGQNDLHNINNDILVEGISIDTRTINQGNAFFALKGANSDGHSRVNDAFELGASLAFVEQNWYIQNKEELKDLPIIVVKNSYKALGETANYHRSRFSIPIIAVAGSNGKTTTKELIASVLSTKFNVLKTYKNYNNQLGVPLMLLQLDESHTAAVIEMGTNSFGEIAELSKIVNPNHALITNINKEHLEVLIDIDGVEIEETNLFNYAKKHDIFSYINLDDTRLKKYTMVLEKRVSYGFTNEAMLVGDVEYDDDLMPTITAKFNQKELTAKINVPGYPGAINALAASAIGLNLDLSEEEVKKGLESFTPDTSTEYGRLSVINKNNIKIINDTYNANPGSVAEMINLVSSFKDKKNIHIVLGDMLELGEETAKEHQLILDNAKSVTTQIYTYGPIYNSVDRNLNFENKSEITSKLLNSLADNDIILVKGSRGMKMEEVVTEILNKIN